MLVTLIVFSVFGAVALLVIGLTARRTSAMESRIHDFRNRAVALLDEESELSIPFVDRIIRPGVEGVARAAGSVLPASMLASIQKQLICAGNPMTLNTFVAFWAGCIV